MPAFDPRSSDDIEREIALGKLYTQMRRALSLGDLPRADKLAQQLLTLAPDTTSTEELLGDLAFARKQYSEARDHYRRALDIEPANVDAERKFGEVVLLLAQAQRLRSRAVEVVEDPSKLPRSKRIPWIAALYSIIPGLGQVYNREYEKGLALVSGGLILLSWVLAQLISYFSADLVATSARRHGKLDTDRAEQVVQAWGPLMWTLVALAIVAYLALWIYSIVDAYRTCKEELRAEDELGVDL